MVAAGLALHIARFQLEYVSIEVGHAFGFARAQGEMADRIVLLPFALGVDFGAVLMALLREIEIISRGIVRAIAREGAVAGTLDDFNVGIFLRNLLAHFVEILNFDPKVIEPRLAAAAARNDGHADITIAHRDRRHFAPRVARDLHAEHGAIKHTEYRVVVGGDGQMVELAEHSCLLIKAARRAKPIQPPNARRRNSSERAILPLEMVFSRFARSANMAPECRRKLWRLSSSSSRR